MVDILTVATHRISVTGIPASKSDQRKARAFQSDGGAFTVAGRKTDKSF